MEEDGYDVSRFAGGVRQDLLCSFCRNVPKDVRLCQNHDHFFCYAHISRYLQRAETCPVCREDLTPETLRRPMEFIKNYLDDLKINCDYHGRGCPEQVRLESLQNHVDQCGFSPALCENQRCRMEINKRDKEDHEKDFCQFKFAKYHDCREFEASQYPQNATQDQVDQDAIMSDLNEIMTNQDEARSIQEQIETIRNEVKARLDQMRASQNKMKAKLKKVRASKNIMNVRVSQSEMNARLEQMRAIRNEMNARLEQLRASQNEMIAEQERMEASQNEINAKQEQTKATDDEKLKQVKDSIITGVKRKQNQVVVTMKKMKNDIDKIEKKQVVMRATMKMMEQSFLQEWDDNDD